MHKRHKRNRATEHTGRASGIGHARHEVAELSSETCGGCLWPPPQNRGKNLLGVTVTQARFVNRYCSLCAFTFETNFAAQNIFHSWALEFAIRATCVRVYWDNDDCSGKRTAHGITLLGEPLTRHARNTTSRTPCDGGKGRKQHLSLLHQRYWRPLDQVQATREMAKARRGIAKGAKTRGSCNVRANTINGMNSVHRI